MTNYREIIRQQLADTRRERIERAQRNYTGRVIQPKFEVEVSYEVLEKQFWGESESSSHFPTQYTI